MPLSTGGTEYLVPFDATFYYYGSSPVTTLPYITGMALVNPDPSITATISCAILNPNGASLGTAAPITLPPMGHTSLQLNAASGFGNVQGISDRWIAPRAASCFQSWDYAFSARMT